jgi:hypothetical protein
MESRISSAVLVQMNGLGFSFHPATHSPMSLGARTER